MNSTRVAIHDLNIADHLSAMARREPYRLAVVVPCGRNRSGRVRYTHFTYRQLDQDSDQIAAGLKAIGIARGARCVVMVPPSLDFFSLTFALFKAGVVPVLIDPGIGLRNLGRCCREAAPEVFIGIPRAVWAQRILGWGGASVRQIVQVGRAPVPIGRPGVMTLDEVRDLGRDNRDQGSGHNNRATPFSPTEAAAILFTSGSTGPPKGAVYTHAIFQFQVNSFRTLFAIEPGEIDLCTFPLFALFAPALGMTAIVPDMDPTRPAHADPARLREAIEDFGVTNLFGSPALLRRLASEGGDAAPKLSTLKRIISAGAPISARILEQLAPRLVFPAELHPTYGATESLPVAAIGSREILEETRQLTDIGKGVCVGRPVDGIEARIIPIRDDPIPTWSDDLAMPQGEIGEIIVAGPVVTREYFNRAEATRLAKILDPERQRFYHRMGDLGYLDDRGRVWFCGRKSHRVIFEGETLFTIPCEGIFNSHPAVSRSALVGATLRGQVVPVICIEPLRRLTRAERNGLRQELLDRASGFAHTRMIRTILFHRSFPVDIRHNAKIFREKLAVWASRRLS
ncbi:MAG: fatty acid CoA ligase family protein [Isosphaeraceae bacterium]